MKQCEIETPQYEYKSANVSICKSTIWIRYENLTMWMHTCMPVSCPLNRCVSVKEGGVETLLCKRGGGLPAPSYLLLVACAAAPRPRLKSHTSLEPPLPSPGLPTPPGPPPSPRWPARTPSWWYPSRRGRRPMYNWLKVGVGWIISHWRDMHKCEVDDGHAMNSS